MGIVQVNQSRRANRLGGNVYCVVQPRFLDAQFEDVASVDSQSENTAFVDTQKRDDNIPNILNNPQYLNKPIAGTYTSVCEVLNKAKAQFRSKGRLKPTPYLIDEAYRICGNDGTLIATAEQFVQESAKKNRDNISWIAFLDYCRKQNLSPKTSDMKSKEHPNDRKTV